MSRSLRQAIAAGLVAALCFAIVLVDDTTWYGPQRIVFAIAGGVWAVVALSHLGDVRRKI